MAYFLGHPVYCVNVITYYFRSAWGLTNCAPNINGSFFIKQRLISSERIVIYNTTVKQSLKIESSHFNDFNDIELITAYIVTFRENNKCLKFYIQKYFLI